MKSPLVPKKNQKRKESAKLWCDCMVLMNSKYLHKLREMQSFFNTVVSLQFVC